MLEKTVTIMECSRIFSLPMTVMSWLVIYTYGLITSGNMWYGLLAFLGICFAHLGTNVIDDYFDYKSLIKRVDFNKSEYLKVSQKTKCRYLVSGVLKEKDVLRLGGIYFSISAFIGLVLFLKCGVGVLYYALAGGLIGVLYPFVSRICLSEVAVALAYGPVLFGGVYYVMMGAYSKEVMLLCIPTMLVTVVLLYIHTVMDYDYDLHEGHHTIANRFNSRLDSLIILKILLISAYISIPFLCIFDILDWQGFLVYLTIPLSVDLYKSLKDFSCNPEEMPGRRWFHRPMEGLEKFEENGEGAFMFRMFQSRNLMIYFALLLTVGIFLSLYL